MPKGGHFAAFEQPELFVDDVRAFFRALALDLPGRTAMHSSRYCAHQSEPPLPRLEFSRARCVREGERLGNPPQPQSAGISLRRTKAQDMESVVALDAAIVGHPRHLYFQRRLKAALDQTERHVQFSAEQDGRFVGFIKARKQLGEFGRAEPALLLEAMAVAPGEQGHGIGSALLARLESEAKRLGVPEIRTTASWRDHAIMQFFDRAGFELSQNHGAGLPDAAKPGRRRMKATRPWRPRTSPAFRQPKSATARRPRTTSTRSRAARSTCARSRPATSTTSSGSIRGSPAAGARPTSAKWSKRRWAIPAVRLSLVARVDGIAAGFVTARADFGDYGRVEPVAVLDTIGVDPDYAHRGVGHALLSQLFANLNAAERGSRGNGGRARELRAARVLLRRQLRTVAAPGVRQAARLKLKAPGTSGAHAALGAAALRLQRLRRLLDPVLRRRPGYK